MRWAWACEWHHPFPLPFDPQPRGRTVQRTDRRLRGRGGGGARPCGGLSACFIYFGNTTDSPPPLRALDYPVTEGSSTFSNLGHVGFGMRRVSSGGALACHRSNACPIALPLSIPRADAAVVCGPVVEIDHTDTYPAGATGHVQSVEGSVVQIQNQRLSERDAAIGRSHECSGPAGPHHCAPMACACLSSIYLCRDARPSPPHTSCMPPRPLPEGAAVPRAKPSAQSAGQAIAIVV